LLAYESTALIIRIWGQFKSNGMLNFDNFNNILLRMTNKSNFGRRQKKKDYCSTLVILAQICAENDKNLKVEALISGSE
jgi:hypothetical protein